MLLRCVYLLFKTGQKTSSLNSQIEGKEDWGVIVCGESHIMLQEALTLAKLNPHILSLGTVYPLPEKLIRSFASKVDGKIFVIEDGDKFCRG